MGKTVKAREHYGADSLDLTIPASVVRDHELSPGDVFEINVEEENDEFVLRYELVHQPE